ncbi:hypothetical protein AB0M54_45780 [Actinoplanes sp. NPDC051470]|uniref:hypothetical protein n=1 Tax=Actinoplanes sp. NPDC051470 TaxID=3157224 RepID=UPI0034483D08
MTDTIDSTRDDLVVSFKPHTGYDSPLIAVKAKDAATMADKLGEIEATGLAAIVANTDQAVKAAFNLANGIPGGATPVSHPQTAQQNYRTNNSGGQQNRPQGPPDGFPPGLTAPECPHGTKRPLVGQYGPFWGCPADRNDPSKCKAEKVPTK